MPESIEVARLRLWLSRLACSLPADLDHDSSASPQPSCGRCPRRHTRTGRVLDPARVRAGHLGRSEATRGQTGAQTYDVDRARLTLAVSLGTGLSGDHGDRRLSTSSSESAWDIFKPNAKEFFQQHSALVSKKRMTIGRFTEARDELIRDPEIREAWLGVSQPVPDDREMAPRFQSIRPPEYRHRWPPNGDRHEPLQAVHRAKLSTAPPRRRVHPPPSRRHRLRFLGAKGLREMLFEQTTVTGLYSFENRRQIFKGVHRGFKFALVSFRKEGRTERVSGCFCAARHRRPRDPPAARLGRHRDQPDSAGRARLVVDPGAEVRGRRGGGSKDAPAPAPGKPDPLVVRAAHDGRQRLVPDGARRRSASPLRGENDLAVRRRLRATAVLDR